MNSAVKHHQPKLAPMRVTPNAKQHIESILKVGDIGVKVSLKKSGCSGYEHHIDIISKKPTGDVYMFDVAKDWSVFVDKKDYPKLQNLCLDYVKKGVNETLVFQNPNAKDVCGCGVSMQFQEQK